MKRSDTNPVYMDPAAFAVLLDSSSLGAPRARRVRERTPTAVRQLLLCRLSSKLRGSAPESG